MNKDDDKTRDEELNRDDDLNHDDEFNIDTATPEEIAMELVNAFAEGDEERAKELIKHQAVQAVADMINKEDDE